MAKRFLFVGAGAIGSYLGAFLSRAEHDVTLVDPWAEQVETIRARGIRVTGPHEPFEAWPRAVHLHEAASLPRDFEIVVVAMKAYEHRVGGPAALRHMAPHGCIVVVRPELLARSGRGAGGRRPACRRPRHVQDRGRGLGAGPGGARRRAGPGCRTDDVSRVGEHDERISPRTQELAEMLAIIDGARAIDNLWGERWAKLSQNAMSNPLQAMSGLGSLEVASSEVGRTLMIALAAESARVGLALGHRVSAFAGAPAERWADAGQPETRDGLDRRRRRPRRAAGAARASMAQDVAKGRRTTEIDEMNGFIVARGQERGVATPVSRAVVETVHEVESGSRPPAPGNLELTLRRAGT